MGTDGIRKKNINPVRKKRWMSPAETSISKEEELNEESQPLFLSNGVKPLDLRPLKKVAEVPRPTEVGLDGDPEDLDKPLAETTFVEEDMPAQAGEILTGPELEHNPFIEKLAHQNFAQQNLSGQARHKYVEEEDRGVIVATDEDPGFRERWTAKKHRVYIGASGVGLLIIFIIASTVFARLTVNVKPRHERVALKDVSAAFDTSVSKLLPAQKVIPAQKFELPKTLSEEFGSTGKKYVEEKARGKVQLYNGFSSSPQALVASTRFVSDSGITLRLPRSITIPGAKIEEGKIIPNFIEIELVADEAGEQGNLPEGANLKIPGFKGTAKHDGFYARTSASFTGGYKGEAKVVTSDDLKKAQEQVTQKIYKELEEEIVRKIPPDFILIDQLRQIEITKVNMPKVEARAERFTVEAKAAAKVIVFRKNDVEDLVQSIVIQEGEAKELVPQEINIQYIVRNIDFSKGRAAILLAGDVTTKTKIPDRELASLIQGKKEGSILEALKSRSELAAFSISFFPPWLFSAPQDPQKIRFIVDN